MHAQFAKYTLNFKRPAGTSRGVLKTKETYFIRVTHEGKTAYGECGLFHGLSPDDLPDYEQKLTWACNNITLGLDRLYTQLMAYPSIQIGLEMAFYSLENNHDFTVFPSAFVKSEAPITINGLIWMGSPEFMQEQIAVKIDQGFRCIKMKIGAIDFHKEFKLLKGIREQFDSSKIVLRVDANGAFKPENALNKLEQLAELDLHSIEQPIQAGNWKAMAQLCAKTPLPIALDEELIGIHNRDERAQLLDVIAPQYIILKPTLVGGFRGSDNWIALAEQRNIDWWITSALESNLGLNAICQYTFTKNTILPQGLGTGSLFTNNIDSPLQVSAGNLVYKQDISWDNQKLESLFSI